MPTSTLLFVDDEQAVLNGVRRSLYKMRSVWKMDFANGGAEAMQMMQQHTYDMLITDIRMPGIDGVELLRWAQQSHPQTLRFVLSGQSDSKHLEQIVGLTHQFLTKPCDADALKLAIQRAEQLRFLLVDPDLQRLVARMKGLPVLPTVLAELMSAITSSGQSLRRVGDIIQRDMGLAAKVLQLVNSPYFGLVSEVRDVQHAATLLGLDALQNLVLAAGVFRELEGLNVPASLLERLLDHSLAVAAVARSIAQDVGLSAAGADHAFLGGVLHDVGKLLLADRFGRDYFLGRAAASNAHFPLSAAETDQFDA
ncbi:MAG: HDOD domain-containing protein, partial [Caldilineaceae bacterium]|nr:HDOD domain-containing protein [Caldilineaceae bacterium]